MSMVRIENGEVTQEGLPRTGVLSDGRSVSGYDQLEPEVLQAEGWRQVQDAGPPEHDPETHYVSRSLEVVNDEVHATYEVRENEPVPPDPVLARIEELENEVRGIKSRAAAADVAGEDAKKVRDAVAGPQDVT